MQTVILYGIVFTFLFLRLSNSLDFKRVLRELHYAPRLIVALLSGINAIAMNVLLAKCRHEFPDFLRLPYFLLATILIVVGYIQLVYFVYAFLRVYVLKTQRLQHHEMQDEDDLKAQRRKEGGPIKSHLKEQKGMKNGDFK